MLPTPVLWIVDWYINSTNRPLSLFLNFFIIHLYLQWQPLLMIQQLWTKRSDVAIGRNFRLFDVRRSNDNQYWGSILKKIVIFIFFLVTALEREDEHYLIAFVKIQTLIWYLSLSLNMACQNLNKINRVIRTLER